jgi:hypothetical protein
MRRYLLASLILILPALLEFIFTIIIPSQTNLVDRLANSNNAASASYSGKYKLGVENYGAFRLPVFLNGTFSTLPLNSLLKNFYTDTNRPGVELVQLTSDIIPNYITERRLLDFNFLTRDLYIGMSLNITSEKKFYSTLYYSTMAFHSSANAINEITNLYLCFLTNDFGRKIVTYNYPLNANTSLYFGDEFIKYLGCFDILPVSIFNMLNSLIIAIIIALNVLQVGRERLSGSRTLQLLSGTRKVTYWASNYIFDLLIIAFNYTTMIFVLKIVDTIRNDDFTNEVKPLADSDNLAFVYLLFIFSSVSCCTLSYLWSFLFNSELISFMVLAILLGVASFLDMLCSFIVLFVNFEASSSVKVDTTLSSFITFVQYVLLLIFPNVTVKRGLYNLKIRKNSYCIISMNRIFKGKKLHFLKTVSRESGRTFLSKKSGFILALKLILVVT